MQAIYGMSFLELHAGLEIIFDHSRTCRFVESRCSTHKPYGTVCGSLKSSVYRVARICVTPILHRDATALATYPVVEFKWPVVAWVLHHG